MDLCQQINAIWAYEDVISPIRQRY